MTVADEGCKPLAQAIDLFSYIHLQLSTHKGAFGGIHKAEHGGAVTAADLGELPAFVVICKAAGYGFLDDQAGFAGGDGDVFLVLGILQGQLPVVKIKFDILFPVALKMDCLDADHILLGGGDCQLQCRAVQIGTGTTMVQNKQI